MKRYQIKLKGWTTEEKWVVVFETNIKTRVLRHYQQWLDSHGSDHHVVIEDKDGMIIHDVLAN